MSPSSPATPPARPAPTSSTATGGSAAMAESLPPATRPPPPAVTASADMSPRDRRSHQAEGRKPMRSRTIFIGLTAATAGIAATLAGCGTAVSGQPSAASSLAATRQDGSHPAARSAQAPSARTAARNNSAPARGSATATAPPSHAPAPRQNVLKLTRGLYTDAPDGKPHYVLA